MTDTLQIIASVVGVGATVAVTVIVALVASARHLRGRFEQLEGRLEQLEGRLVTRLERIEDRMEDFGAGIRSLNQQLAYVVGVLPTVFTFLHRNQAISDEEYRESVGQFTSRIAQRTESLVDYLARSMNPLTSSEAKRFKALVGQARRGQFFTYEEAVEYDKWFARSNPNALMIRAYGPWWL